MQKSIPFSSADARFSGSQFAAFLVLQLDGRDLLEWARLALVSRSLFERRRLWLRTAILKKDVNAL